MSYSFSVRAATKAEAKAAVATQLAAVVEGQPVHATDCVQAQAAADAFVDLLSDDDTKDIVVQVHGSISTCSLQKTTAASVGVAAWLDGRG